GRRSAGARRPRDRGGGGRRSHRPAGGTRRPARRRARRRAGARRGISSWPAHDLTTRSRAEAGGTDGNGGPMRERATKDAQGTCAVCGDRFPRADLVPAEMVRPAVAEMIRAEIPSWSDADAICARDHARFRARQVQSLLKEEIGELGDLEREVVEVLGNQSLLAANTQAEFDRSLSFGERIADRVARFGGSWAFILSFLFLLAAWIAVNSVLAFRKPFDPFPFILLNLILSCVAALQAPVIMMSQNRQEAKDRLRAE